MTEVPRTIIFDLDGTLVPVDMFDPWHSRAKQYLADSAGVGVAEINTRFKEAWEYTHKLAYVHPLALISHTLGVFQRRYPQLSRDIWRQFDELLESVYTEPVSLYEDVQPTFDFLLSRNIQIGILTHADKTWTEHKLRCTGLGRYLIYNKAFSVRTWAAKNSSDWMHVARYYRADLSTTWAIGDNVGADSNAAFQAGYRRSFWLDRGEPDFVTHSRKGTPLEGVIQVASLLDLRQRLDEL